MAISARFKERPLVEWRFRVMVHLVAGGHRLGLLLGKPHQAGIDYYRAETVILAV